MTTTTTMDRLWDRDNTMDRVVVGQVVDDDGRPLRLRTLIHRLWGWPKSAADLAAEHLRAAAAHNGVAATLWLSSSSAVAQQQLLLQQVPGLLQSLLVGLAKRTSRERHDVALPVRAIEIAISEPISDDGLTKGVLEAIALRLGVSVDELRSRVVFSMGRDVGGFDDPRIICVDVDVDGLDLGTTT